MLNLNACSVASWAGPEFGMRPDVAATSTDFTKHVTDFLEWSGVGGSNSEVLSETAWKAVTYYQYALPRIKRGPAKDSNLNPLMTRTKPYRRT